MGLFESAEHILNRYKGKMPREEFIRHLNDKYAKDTINTFLEKHNDVFIQKDQQVELKDYEIEAFLWRIRDEFFRNPYASRPETIKFIAYLFTRKRLESIGNKELLYSLNDKAFYSDHNIENKFNELFDSFSFWKNTDRTFFYRLSSRFFALFIRYHFSKSAYFWNIPLTLNELIAKLSPEKKSLEVYNPYARLMETMTGLHVFAGGEIKHRATEHEEEARLFGQLFALANNIEPNIKPSDAIIDIDNIPDKHFDYIFSIPPFQKKTPHYRNSTGLYREEALNIITKSLDKLAANGRAVFVVPDSYLFAYLYRKFRRKIVESGYLKTVISLPEKLLYPTTSLKTSLLLFENSSQPSDSIRFIEADQKYAYELNRDKTISLKVSWLIDLLNNKQEDANQVQEAAGSYARPKDIYVYNRNIRDNGFSLFINRYLFSQGFSEENGYFPLGKIAFRPELTLNREESLPFIRIKDLNGEVIENSHELNANETKTSGFILDQPAILIGSIKGSYKPTFFTGSFTAEVSKNIHVVKANEEKVHLPYLLQELSAEYVQQQMNLLAKGTTGLKHLSNNDLSDIQIFLPELKEQKRKLDERNEFISAHAYSKTKSDKTPSDIDVFKTMKHEIGNLLIGPSSFLDLLPDFLEQFNISLNEPFVKREGSQTIGEKIEIAQNRLGQVNGLLENLKGILHSDEKYFSASKENLVSLFKNRLIEMQDQRLQEYYIGIDGNFKKHTRKEAEVDATQFDYLIRNIIKNAIDHNRSKNSISLIINIKDSNEQLEIHFMNNGEPFPAHFGIKEYIAYGGKTSESNGQGLGGYLIYKIARNHNGKLDILPAGQEVPVSENKSIRINVDIVLTIPKIQ
ncbi:MAG: N-6 DNA methylase [Bacteroidales bacterium]|nr:N-6 DNA methylase [Bacteroidales bacterium]